MLETERLLFIPFTLQYATAAAQGREVLQRVFPYAVSEQWPNEDYAQIIPQIVQLLKMDPTREKWGWLLVDKQDKTLMGEIGCKGGPNERGIVEIGYGIVPAYQSKGYAAEAASGLVEWLKTLPQVKKIIADCLIENLASARVLQKAGFTKIKEKDGFFLWEIKEW
ncbi:GNAT family N-acetyltransferase [Peribacillus sp. SCS-155]|uniref:GNAT family N-acetyltransferase n=1 Tax=Peribacillus sedimenti TaxID=3115297 RepID=UPI003905925B